MHRCFVFSLLFLICAKAVAGGEQYFMFPIKTKNALSITATMGELRTNHYHGGIDVRTDYATGLPLYACADGYISRIQVNPSSYGNMLQIRHPNGLSTLYAHMDRFSPEIHGYAIAEMTKYNINECDLAPDSSAIHVCRGDVIGYSGNTGASAGPHLHFEIRDTSFFVMNPFKFGFKELIDTYNPYFSGLAIAPFGLQSTVANGSGRQEIKVVSAGGNNYKIGKTIEVAGRFGLEILARDRINNGTTRTGITCIELKVDGKEVYCKNLERLSLERNSDINMHMNYERFLATGQKYQRCYDNESSSFDPSKRTLGLQELPPGEHEIEIAVYDAYLNFATLRFKIRSKKFDASEMIFSPLDFAKPKVMQDVITIATKAGEVLSAYQNGEVITPKPTILGKNGALYRISLRPAMYDSIAVGKKVYNLSGYAIGKAGSGCQITNGLGQFTFNSESLFQELAINFAMEDSQLKIGNPSQPLKGKYRAKIQLPPGIMRTEKYAAFLHLGRRYVYQPTEVAGRVISFESKYFGSFAIAADSTPPRVRLIKSNASGIRAILADNLSGVRSYEARSDGKWLVLHYDKKNAVLWSDELSWARLKPNKVFLTVTDNCGNRTEVIANI